MSSLEDKITPDNPVRFIDAFVELIDLEKIGFTPVILKTEGHPSFKTEVFLKIYLYGYLNGIRSSKKLEKECIRNIEMQWLLADIRPNYHSISDFRKENPKVLKKLFKLFLSFLKDVDLITGETIAIDGTKSRAHNGKKSNFNQKKIDKHLAYIDTKTQEYLDELEKNDEKENVVKINNIQQKIARLQQNKIRYELLEKQLKVSGEPHPNSKERTDEVNKHHRIPIVSEYSVIGSVLQRFTSLSFYFVLVFSDYNSLFVLRTQRNLSC
ncbi:transposase [Flavobacterium oreochromis]|uniref:Transposase n=1 Tax=Flavobacterium oreochromis TaxID=2906078 RepID=A0ABW8PCK5_9FLAO|nr:transposase [Flavobacterium oreochromis]